MCLHIPWNTKEVCGQQKRQVCYAGDSPSPLSRQFGVRGFGTYGCLSGRRERRGYTLNKLLVPC